MWLGCPGVKKFTIWLEIGDRISTYKPSKISSFQTAMVQVCLDGGGNTPPKDCSWTALTDERPFSCGICSKGFGTLFNLKQHTNTVHSKHESYYCKDPTCDRNIKAFSCQNNLSVHETRIHKRFRSIIDQEDGMCFGTFWSRKYRSLSG